MHTDRRTVLTGLLAGATVGCGDDGTASAPDDTGAGSVFGSLTDTADPLTDTGDAPALPDGYTLGEWVPSGDEDLGVFPHGLQVGDVTATSAVLSVRPDAPEVRIEVVGLDDDGWWPVHTDQHLLDDRAAQHELTGLQPDTRYAWVARTTDATRSVLGRFRTPPTSDRIVRFGAVSCLGGNLPWPCLSRAAEDDLDVFLFLGDTVYADWGFFESVQEKWDTALAQQGMRDLCASTSVIATWDDHEVDNNFTPENTDAWVIDEGRRAFREALPQRVGDQGQIWRRLPWGDVVEFFVLDCRGERIAGDYISRAQLDWLKQGLADSTARFKVVLNSVPITDLSFVPIAGDIDAYDRWQGYPEQRQELVDHCAGIEGVLFVSGDFHVGAAAYIEPENAPGGHLKEILCGPGGSPISSAYALIPEGGRLPMIITQFNYTRFECDPDRGQITVSWIGNGGEVLGSLTMTA
jgi:phosphodiesterase/alkaline phosphatase D-like protein